MSPATPSLGSGNDVRSRAAERTSLDALDGGRRSPARWRPEARRPWSHAHAPSTFSSQQAGQLVEAVEPSSVGFPTSALFTAVDGGHRAR